MAGQGGYPGLAGAAAPTSEYNGLDFMIRQLMAGASHATLVLVVSVTNNGGVSPAGTVDVQPMVNQVDGAGNATPHGIVHGLPYYRIQGGTNAVILDPVAGDIGLAVFADQDVSSVKATKKRANPGSRRRNSMSDGFYFGSFFGATPTQYMRFSATGIAIVTPGNLTITAASMTHNGVNVGATHVHGGVQSGGSNTSDRYEYSVA